MLNIREMENAKVVNRKKPDHISVFFMDFSSKKVQIVQHPSGNILRLNAICLLSSS
jgi:hypothetical protein